MSHIDCRNYNQPTYIAVKKTIDDWQKTSQILKSGGSVELWKRVVDEYYLGRLGPRYLNPIQILQRPGLSEGEGFSIVAIQCSLIEFLESTVRGITYHYLEKGEKLGEYEYSRSGDIFVQFLTSRVPFSEAFRGDRDLAHDFYVGVRCGLLHEARTKNGWRIRDEDRNSKDIIVDVDRKMVFRDGFQSALKKFIADYAAELPHNADYQTAFVRKYDSLCE
jgi:hypothetical protein